MERRASLTRQHLGGNVREVGGTRIEDVRWQSFLGKGDNRCKGPGHISRLGAFLKTIKEACEMKEYEPRREKRR